MKTEELHNRIAALEIKKHQQEREIKEEVETLIHNMQPLELIKKSISGIKDKYLTSHVKLPLVYAGSALVKKIFVRKSNNVLIKLIGNVLSGVIAYKSYSLFNKIRARV